MRIHGNVLLTKLTKPRFNQKIDIEIESDFFKYLVPVLRVFEWYKLKKWHPPWILKLFLCLKLNLRLPKLICYRICSSQHFPISNLVTKSTWYSFIKVAWFQKGFFALALISKKKVANNRPEQLLFRWIVFRGFCSFFGDWSQSKNPSEMKPTLKSHCFRMCPEFFNIHIVKKIWQWKIST